MTITHDPNDPDYDEAQQRAYAWCRGCKQMKYDVLNDNGYCGDCD